MDVRKIMIIIVAVICIAALGFGIYYEIFKDNIKVNQSTNNTAGGTTSSETKEFDDLFDNEMNYQGYSVNDQVKIDQTKELVYTNYSLTEIYENKYDIKANIPFININSEKIANINKEINTIFQEKANSIIANKDKGTAASIYTVDYTAYLNQNILSIIIKSTIREGGNVQRLIIKAYTYNLSTDEIIPLSNMLEIQAKDTQTVENDIRKVIQESISYTDNLAAIGYTVYERDINSTIYKVENSNNYFLGPNNTIYIIYAYGNSSFTSEKDIVVLE